MIQRISIEPTLGHKPRERAYRFRRSNGRVTTVMGRSPAHALRRLRELPVQDTPGPRSFAEAVRMKADGQ